MSLQHLEYPSPLPRIGVGDEAGEGLGVRPGYYFTTTFFPFTIYTPFWVGFLSSFLPSKVK